MVSPPKLKKVILHSPEMHRDESGNSIDEYAVGTPSPELSEAFTDSRTVLNISLNFLEFITARDGNRMEA
ncbi:MAG: hypothetical protein MMC33_009482 [Icmadophila ericetorum]|nr:hypothetical protein [Icmadophila ericetorum]